MTTFETAFISSGKYNSLPTIHDVADVSEHHKDRDDLCALLRKHSLPLGINVRLIHKHFDTLNNEVMVFRSLGCSSVANFQIMGPMLLPHVPTLRGLHYLVDEFSHLQPYEYTTSEGPDLSQYPAFLEEFTEMIVDRGLQRKWGLKSGLDGDNSYTEFEVPEKRSTIMIPTEVALPTLESTKTVVTDWANVQGTSPLAKGNCIETRSTHHQTSKVGKDEYYLADTRLERGSVIYDVVRSGIMAM
jgi:hypothetical protein